MDLRSAAGWLDEEVAGGPAQGGGSGSRLLLWVRVAVGPECCVLAGALHRVGEVGWGGVGWGA